MRWALATGRTARELLASVTSEDITEMMAFERHEPFGALADEFRAGQIAAVIANVNRGEKTEPFVASDFMPALHMAFERVKAPAQLLEDPEAQSALLDAILFGKAAND